MTHVERACSCEAAPTVRIEFAGRDAPARAACPACGEPHELPAPAERLDQGGGLVTCLACGHPELYTRKAFPRALGFAIVIGAAVLAPWTRYLSLGVAAILDFVIYHLAPEDVTCYVCGARHRGFPDEPRHPRYDPTIPERLRYGDKAVMGSPLKGTAGAPEPEH